MRPIKFIALTFLLCFCFFKVEAQDSPQIATTHYPPFQFEKDGTVEGFSTQVVRAILKRANLDIPINLYPWARAERILNNHPNVLFYNLSRTPAREDKYVWLADITPTEVYLWKLKDRQDIELNADEDLTYYTIGVMPNTVSHQFLRSKEVSETSFIQGSNADDLILMLIHGRIDMIPLDDVSFTYRITELGYSRDQFEKVLYLKEISSRSYLAASQGTSQDIINKIRSAWITIQEDGSYSSIMEHYLSP